MERELIGRMQAGDPAAVTELATIYGPRIHQLAFRYMKNWEDAEEVTQDVLLKVFRKIDAFRGDAALSSWNYRITFNTAMSRLRTGRQARAAEQQRAAENAAAQQVEQAAVAERAQDAAEAARLEQEARRAEERANQIDPEA
jgi:RNA polymerase sigma-70 factor (ECF subfamily)